MKNGTGSDSAEPKTSNEGEAPKQAPATPTPAAQGATGAASSSSSKIVITVADKGFADTIVDWLGSPL